MQKYTPLLLILLVVVAGFLLFNKQSSKPQEIINQDEIRYVALGDSYTKGDGATVETSWPVVLTEHLKREGIKIRLIANPSQTGWTTEEVIDHELSVFEDSRPTFATILIGTNDWAVGMDEKTFQKKFSFILDKMQQQLPDKRNIVVLTNPDFSFTPLGKNYAARDITVGLQRFNAIIEDEARKRDLTVVDLFPVSQRYKDDLEYLSIDGLHPSAKGYAVWEEAIYPVVYEVLKSNRHSDKRIE